MSNNKKYSVKMFIYWSTSFSNV